MRKNNLWLKVIVIIIIQALFLTQVDFSLAAASAYNNIKETYQEFAAKAQKIKDSSAGLTTNIELIVDGVSINSFDATRLFYVLLKEAAWSVAGINLKNQYCKVNKEIYKVFFDIEETSSINYQLIECVLERGDNLSKKIEEKTVKARAPPLLKKEIMEGNKTGLLVV